MKKEQDPDLKFLEEQLQWCKEQDCILAKMEIKLHEMKELAEYVAGNDLDPVEAFIL